MQKTIRNILFFVMVCFTLLLTGCTECSDSNCIKVPSEPELIPVKVDPANTALLMLDLQQQTCNQDRRPRCVERIPLASDFLSKAREKNMLVVHSLIPNSNAEDLLEGVKPLENEQVVASSVDKFYNTELETILRDNSIETVIIFGTTAEGAVLHTATGASMRGFNVIVAVDGMSAGELYAEQYTAWHMLNAPGTRRSTNLTKIDMIEIG